MKALLMLCLWKISKLEDSFFKAASLNQRPETSSFSSSSFSSFFISGGV